MNVQVVETYDHIGYVTRTFRTSRVVNFWIHIQVLTYPYMSIGHRYFMKYEESK